VPPLRATQLAGWSMLVLRAFLGFTFCFAGLQKLANPGFFTATNPASIQSQLAGAARRSPVHALVAPLVHVAGPLGVLIALAELAVGLGTVLGLWTRLAAIGGMALSGLLFLTVSFHASPYYTGSDIVFVFAWTPLVISGAGGVLSLDAVLANVARQRAGIPPDAEVALAFSTVRELCGYYKKSRCQARGGAACEPQHCPVLGPQTAMPARQIGAIDRRTFSLKGAWTVAVAVAGGLGAALVAGVGRAVGGNASGPRLGNASAATGGRLPPPTSTSTTAGPSNTSSAPPSTSGGTTPTTKATPTTRPPGTRIGPASAVPVAGAASFQDPASGDPSLVVQPTAGTFLAFDAVCPHAGCIVQYDRSGVFICPCHGSQFNGKTGDVETGPAPTGLTKLTLRKGSDGMLYVDG
jgi:thiosulfate dehydrogenase [quinone] large subunit